MSLVWSMKFDKELDQFDHKKNPEVFWGTDKQAIISEGNNKMFFPEMGCCIKSFRLQKAEQINLSK